MNLPYTGYQPTRVGDTWDCPKQYWSDDHVVCLANLDTTGRQIRLSGCHGSKARFLCSSLPTVTEEPTPLPTPAPTSRPTLAPTKEFDHVELCLGNPGKHECPEDCNRVVDDETCRLLAGLYNERNNMNLPYTGYQPTRVGDGWDCPKQYWSDDHVVCLANLDTTGRQIRLSGCHGSKARFLCSSLPTVTEEPTPLPTPAPTSRPTLAPTKEFDHVELCLGYPGKHECPEECNRVVDDETCRLLAGLYNERNNMNLPYTGYQPTRVGDTWDCPKQYWSDDHVVCLANLDTTGRQIRVSGCHGSKARFLCSNLPTVTEEPTAEPTKKVTDEPTAEPTEEPTQEEVKPEKICAQYH